jgi:hypothetical protein
MSNNCYFQRCGDRTTPLIGFYNDISLQTIEQDAYTHFQGRLPDAMHIEFYSGKAGKFLVLNDDLLKSDYNPFATNIPAKDEDTGSIQVYIELFIVDDSGPVSTTNSPPGMYNTFKITTTKFIYYYFL